MSPGYSGKLTIYGNISFSDLFSFLANVSLHVSFTTIIIHIIKVFCGVSLEIVISLNHKVIGEYIIVISKHYNARHYDDM